jgi:hypothetical protein
MDDSGYFSLAAQRRNHPARIALCERYLKVATPMRSDTWNSSLEPI